MRTGAGKVSDVSHPETLRPLALDSDCPDRAGKVVGGVKCDRVAPAGPVPRARTLPGPAGGVWAPAPHGGVAVTVRVHVRPRSGALSRKHPAQGARGDTGHVSPPSPGPTSGHSASPLPQRQGRESGGPGGPAPRRPGPPGSAPHMHSRFQPLQPGRGRASCGKRRSASCDGPGGLPAGGCSTGLPRAHLLRANRSQRQQCGGTPRAPRRTSSDPTARSSGGLAPASARGPRPAPPAVPPTRGQRATLPGPGRLRCKALRDGVTFAAHSGLSVSPSV